MTTDTAIIDPYEIGDEDGLFVGCWGHVDLDQFKAAAYRRFAENGASAPEEEVSSGTSPRHAYGVTFRPQGDYRDEWVWWQLDPENPDAEAIRPITIWDLDDTGVPRRVERAYRRPCGAAEVPEPSLYQPDPLADRRFFAFPEAPNA